MRPKLYFTEEEKRQARLLKQRRYRNRLRNKLIFGLKEQLMKLLSGIEVEKLEDEFKEDEPKLKEDKSNGATIEVEKPDEPNGTIMVLPRKEDAPESKTGPRDLTSVAATYRSLTREEALYVGSTMRYIGTLRRKGGWSELELKKMLDDEMVKFREGKRQ